MSVIPRVQSIGLPQSRATQTTDVTLREPRCSPWIQARRTFSKHTVFRFTQTPISGIYVPRHERDVYRSGRPTAREAPAALPGWKRQDRTDVVSTLLFFVSLSTDPVTRSRYRRA